MKKLLCTTLAMLALVACSETPPPPAPPKVVRTLIVGAGDDPELVRNKANARTYSGEVHARHETTLGFRIPGKIIARLVDAGGVVGAGQPLARLDAADAGLQASQAGAQAALALAETKRYRELRLKNFVSQAALDVRETTLIAAQAQAGLARNQAAYATLAADRAGVIVAVLAEPGQVVTAGQPVFRLAPDGEREVAINLPETEVAHFAAGMPAEVSLWAQGQAAPALAGKIREITPLADPATRTYAVRVALPGANPRLPLGLTASVRFPEAKTAGATALRLPLAAVFQQGAQMAVWIVGADNTVSLRPVTVAALADDGARITAGLTGGERIVAAGVHKLTAGEKVRLAESAR